MEESEATSRNSQEVNGGKQVMKKILTKHSEVKKKVVRMEPGGTTTDHQETGNAKREIQQFPSERQRWAIHNQN